MHNADFERRFLLDYLWFGCRVLALQSRVLNEAHNVETDVDRRRAYFLSIHTNLIQQCEQVGAWLLALRRWAENGTPLVETLLRYGPGEAYLDARLAGIADGHHLLRVSGIDAARLVPAHLPQGLFDERVADLWMGLSYYAGEQTDRGQLYNKSKHGMVYFSSAIALNPDDEDLGPLAVYAQDRRAEPLEVSFVGLRDDPDQPRVMASQTLRMAHALGDIILFYLLQEHPGSDAEIDRILRSRASMLMLP